MSHFLVLNNYMPTPKTMAQLRMEKTTPEQRSEIARNAVKARWKKTTKKERREYAKMMVEARKK
jgi:hypothetical protein